MTWLEDIINALENLGGKATYSELNDYISRTTARDLSPTWQNTVRQTILDHSSDSTSFRSGKDIFYSIGGKGAGYWGLRNWAAIKEIRVENYKSIQKLKIELGRVTVLIGENGCGKSNILEAIAFASAAANGKLDNEFLASRGIRVTPPKFMLSAFGKDDKEIKISINTQSDQEYSYALKNESGLYSQWVDLEYKYLGSVKKLLTHLEEYQSLYGDVEVTRTLFDNLITEKIKPLNLHSFLIYSPENQALRTFEEEGQIQPLGINGQGLFKLLSLLSSKQYRDQFTELKTKLELINWFEDIKIPQNISQSENYIQIKDKYLKGKGFFDQRSSNEGFLFLLFYFALFISDATPKFFAIDNIDASLNPKLCTKLMRELIDLAEKYDKQVILTTHNPAILDGLNLNSDEERLYVLYRNKFGHTKTKRILKPKLLTGQEPVKLSEAFLRGYLGGLPKNF